MESSVYKSMDLLASGNGPQPRSLVEIEGIGKTFGGVQAVTEVSLAIEANEFFTLLGPSGCGKTTLLRLLAGFEHPTSGRIVLDGNDLTPYPPNKRPINTVFQSYALFPHMTVAQNVAFGLERLGTAKADVATRVKEALRLVRLEDYGERRPSQLSGGQQQRVALARALAPAPRVLLLDEPLSALDLKLRREMQMELKRLQRNTGITFVLVTHDQEEALSMSDRIAVMNAGRILQVGTPVDIYERPRTRFVADFIGEANIIPGPFIGSASKYVAVRPERVSISDAKSAETSYVATLQTATYLGSDTVFDLCLEDGTPVSVVTRNVSRDFKIGQAVYCGFPVEFRWDLED